MDLDLSGRRALVTGSTAGIGLAIARALAQLGAEVAVNGRTAERVGQAIETLRQDAAEGRFTAAPGDVGTEQGAAQVIEAVPEADILVNNAGIFEPKPFFDIPDEDWRRFFEVNVLSGIRLSRRYAPGMAERGWGRILFVSSESALNIPREMIHYGMTKTAQLAVSRGLAIELAATGVTVNAILPGPTRSEGVERFLEDMARHSGRTLEQVEADFFRNERPSSLIRRFADPDEVANLAAYLCSPRAAATTGAALRVDGGVVSTIT
jgi:NAD(P)-dependent dehydrogenase (short-subunit alcohol dehydrogenase family)